MISFSLLYIFMKKKQASHWKIRYSIISIIVCVFLVYTRYNTKLDIQTTIYVKVWDNFWQFTRNLSTIDQIRTKLYAKIHTIDLSKIAVWSYMFSWSYTLWEYFDRIQSWPTSEYISYTILEWWSTYDIAEDLSNKNYVTQESYTTYLDQQLTNKTNNKNTRIQQFPFLEYFSQDLPSREWFLYPDTYFIDTNKDFMQQLHVHHLRTFQSKVRWPYEQLFISFNERLKKAWFRFTLSPYDIIILASVIEKEERNDNNKSTIAGIFLNRLDTWMRIDADITLCYWLKQSYKSCTPSVIVANLYDKTNLYNTRQRTWLPPQPITNPSATTIASLLNFIKTDYIFYLHAPNWQIHYWKDLQEHNFNKSKYLP